MKLLLLSNSTMVGMPFFEWPQTYVETFLQSKGKKLAFIPYAAVTFSYEEYFEKVKTVFDELGHQLHSIHDSDDKKQIIEASDGVVVGGGNTFHLLTNMYKYDLIQTLRKNVLSGGFYIGWSAGANLSCPTIGTTNDMPIIQPESFNALNLVKLQINPHFTEATIPGHGGEPRSLRIKEFLEVNRDKSVIGLPEGTLIEADDKRAELKGNAIGKLFQYSKEPVDIAPGADVYKLINGNY